MLRAGNAAATPQEFENKEHSVQLYYPQLLFQADQSADQTQIDYQEYIQPSKRIFALMSLNRSTWT